MPPIPPANRHLQRTLQPDHHQHRANRKHHRRLLHRSRHHNPPSLDPQQRIAQRHSSQALQSETSLGRHRFDPCAAAFRGGGRILGRGVRLRRASGRRLIRPVQIRVGDDLVLGRRAPCRLILRRVGVADQDRVIPPGDGAMQRRADAPIGLRADDNHSPDPEAGQHGVKRGVLERIAIALLDQRLCLARSQLRDDLPPVASPRAVIFNSPIGVPGGRWRTWPWRQRREPDQPRPPVLP